MDFNEDIEPGLRIVVIFIFLVLIGIATGDFQCLGDAEAQEKPLKFPPRKTVFDPPGLSQKEYEFHQTGWLIGRMIADRKARRDSLYQTIVVGIALDLYRSYSTECYADSTHKELYDIRYLTTGLPDSLIEGYVAVLEQFWSHRKPTFLGFMAWLEKKYGVE